MDELATWLTRLTFADLTREQVTARIIDAVAAWGEAQGWRVYRRAPSVMTLPPPLDNKHSVLDVALARPGAPPIAVEIDHTDRSRTVAKLRAEADAGRVAVWVRWGPGHLAEPPAPIRMIPLAVSRRQGRYSRGTQQELPAPAHSPGVAAGEAAELPLADGNRSGVPSD
jgi:hypothetical protein